MKRAPLLGALFLFMRIKGNALQKQVYGLYLNKKMKGRDKMPFKDLPGAEPCFFNKGENLISVDQKLEYVYYLKKGNVNREIITTNGIESVLSFKQAGQGIYSIVGILYLYNEDFRYVSANDFVAMTDCECYKIPVESIKAYLRHHPEELEKVITVALKESLAITQRYLAKTETPIHVVFCRWMINHLIKEGEEYYLPKKYTNIEMAKHMTVHKVTISRMLRALREEGTLERTKKGLHVLNYELLREHAEDVCRLEYR